MAGPALAALQLLPATGCRVEWVGAEEARAIEAGTAMITEALPSRIEGTSDGPFAFGISLGV